MSEQFHPIVEAKMVTDSNSEDFGRVNDVELAHEAAIVANENVTPESSGDFYQDDIEKESAKQIVLKIGELAAVSTGVRQELAADVAATVMSTHSSDILTGYEDDKEIARAMHSARVLEDAASRIEHRAA